MLALNSFKKCLLLLVSAAVFADPTMIVPHQDPIYIDESLSLSKLLDLTMEKYPDTVWLTSLEAEAAAIRQRSESWTAGASQAGLRLQEATSGTLHYLDAHVQVPLWNLGQRNAEKAGAEQAETSAVSQSVAIKLRVAGLIRAALWDIALANIRYEQAQTEVSSN